MSSNVYIENPITVVQKTNDGSGNPIPSIVTDGTKRGLAVNIAGSQMNLFGRLRVADITSIFELHNANGINPLFFNSAVVGTGAVAFNANNASAQLSVGTPSGDSIIYQTRSYQRYNPGRPYLTSISGGYKPSNANVRARWGYFDGSNGMGFQATSTVNSIFTTTSTSGSPVTTVVDQSSWNLDNMSGSGGASNPSGATLNTANHTLYLCEFLWHGAGMLRWSVYMNGFPINVHEIPAGSVSLLLFWRSPSLPIRVELTNTGVSAGTTNIQFVCCAFTRESGDNAVTNASFSQSNGVTTKSVTNAALLPLIAIAPATTFNGITNRVPISPQWMTIYPSGSTNLYGQILLNATLTGASFATAGTNSSAVFDVAASAVSGGTKIGEFYINSPGTQNVDLSQFLPISQLGLDVAGSTAETLTIAARVISGAANNTLCTIQWEENQ